MKTKISKKDKTLKFTKFAISNEQMNKISGGFVNDVKNTSTSSRMEEAHVEHAIGD